MAANHRWVGWHPRENEKKNSTAKQTSFNTLAGPLRVDVKLER